MCNSNWDIAHFLKVGYWGLSEFYLLSVLQESFEGQMTEDNIELGVCNEQGFRRLTPAEVKDYLASIVS